MYITVSTGIGGGAIIDGRPLIGPDGMAGEIGHLVVELDGPICGCGGVGHVEAIASGTALAREASALARRAVPRRACASSPPTARRSTPRCWPAPPTRATPPRRAPSTRAWAAIGALCASLVNVLNPEVIVIGGSIAEHRPRAPRGRRARRSRAARSPSRQPACGWSRRRSATTSR